MDLQHRSLFVALTGLAAGVGMACLYLGARGLALGAPNSGTMLGFGIAVLVAGAMMFRMVRR